ncbi:MAG TPA: hypothetical protein VHP36_04640 [Chitinispirillaceae bacterium]|nr:hypothetical protein [Chitinispirillaceae bacterium]
MKIHTKKYWEYFINGLSWFVWEFMGLHFIWHMLKPELPEEEKKHKPPVTFGLWFMGIYTALFGLAVLGACQSLWGSP